MSGTPKKDLYASSPASRKYLKRGCRSTCSTAIGRTCSATSPARPSWIAMRRVPMHSRAQAQSRGQHQVGPVRLQQIRRAHIGLKPPRDQRHHVHQRFRGLAAFPREVADFLQSQNVICFARDCWVCHFLHSSSSFSLAVLAQDSGPAEQRGFRATGRLAAGPGRPSSLRHLGRETDRPRWFPPVPPDRRPRSRGPTAFEPPITGRRDSRCSGKLHLHSPTGTLPAISSGAATARCRAIV